MPSRLSSLLVRDGLVGVKRMEKAFQRQVIYGGTLDTILLEMNLVPEERLLQYLSLSTGVPPATRAETDVFDADAVKQLPRAVAEQYAVAPLSYDGETLRVVVKEPVDFGRLEELADEIGMPIQPLVVPEYRYHVVFDRAYEKEGSARFGALAERSVEKAATSPVGKPATVIIEADEPAPDEDTGVVDVPVPPMARKTLPIQQVAEPRARAASSNDAIPRPVDDSASAELTQPRARQAQGELASAAPPTVHPGPPTSKIKVTEPPPEPPARKGLDPSPITPAEAERALAEASDRDSIFGALLRAVRSRAWYSGLLTVQGGVAIGRVAIAGSEVDTEEIGATIIPLDVASPFQQAVTTAAPYIGPIATGNDEIDGMIRRMGGVVPPAALLLPIALRNRAVALVIGHRGADSIAITEVSELLPLASATAEAISRLIIKAKQVGYRPARDESAPHIRPELVEATKPSGGDGEWVSPAKRAETAPRVSFATDTAVPPSSSRPVSELLDLVESESPEAAEATTELLRRAGETVPVLAERFPGKLHIDRYALGGRPVRAERHGPLLGLVVKLGTAAADLLVSRMSDPNRDVRYYATLCTSELRPRSALRELVERLFDTDYGVRNAAIEALGGYPIAELETALEGARRALHADDPNRVQAAANALGELADVKSIPDLLDSLGGGGASAEAVRGALSVLTRQDFGTSVRKWRSWWNKNSGHSRIEWLLDALGHKSSALRKGAAEDLRRLTGEYFGYHHDLPKREREEARKKWLRWWNETGRRRFLREGVPEDKRPTAVLPTRDP